MSIFSRITNALKNWGIAIEADATADEIAEKVENFQPEATTTINNLTAQMTEMQSKFEGIQAQVTALQSQITELSTENASLRDMVSVLTAENESLKAGNTDLTAQLASVQGDMAASKAKDITVPGFATNANVDGLTSGLQAILAAGKKQGL